MAFSDFKTISEVQEKFSIKYNYRDFFVEETKDPSGIFSQELEFSLQHFDIFNSEATRCEIVIFPIL